LKPLYHAKLSVKKYGGKVEDYLEIHNFIDSSKASLPDVRHRAILHSSFGIFIVEKVFGVYLINSNGKDVNVRDIAEEHVIQDLGVIPTVENWLYTLPIESWMAGDRKRYQKKVIDFD
jgi:hypothetical protein